MKKKNLKIFIRFGFRVFIKFVYVLGYFLFENKIFNRLFSKIIVFIGKGLFIYSVGLKNLVK